MRGILRTAILILTIAFQWITFADMSFAAETSPSNAPWDGKTFKGLVTIGCGDIYVHAGGGDTWFASLAPSLRAQMLKQAGLPSTSDFPWITIYSELEGNVQEQSHPGFFSAHQRVLVVARILNSRGLETGESTKAAAASKIYKGFVLVGPESYGFIPLTQKDEFWSVVAGEATQAQLFEHFKPEPSISGDGRMYQALVEIRGRVGPPGAYGHMGDFDREVAADDFKFVNFVDTSALAGTAGMVDINSGSSTSKIRKCIKPEASP